MTVNGNLYAIIESLILRLTSLLFFGARHPKCPSTWHVTYMNEVVQAKAVANRRVQVLPEGGRGYSALFTITL